MSNNKPLETGDVVGILGGGQLGKMMAMAAARLGLKCHVYCPDADSPAFDVSAEKTVAAYDNFSALKKFAKSVKVVTYEFENVPHETASEILKHTEIRPGVHPLMVSQDRLEEKNFLLKLGIPVAPFASVDCLNDISDAAVHIGLPAILKTRKFGYDGKGQVLITPQSDLKMAWKSIGKVPAVLEKQIDFVAECSVIVARGLDGTIETYDVVENTHQNRILKWSQVPANSLNNRGIDEALDLGRTICESLDYVGVMAVEMFVLNSDCESKIVVNEIAPRVHNSGHWTEDGCFVSQFEQHIRAIAGWSLGSTQRQFDIKMENLIGDDILQLQSILSKPDAKSYVYRKNSRKPGRKMGHVNWLFPHNFLNSNVSYLEDIATAVNRIGLPSILKTRSPGNDWNRKVSAAQQIYSESIWQSISESLTDLEKSIDFIAENIRLVARKPDGSLVTCDVAKDTHQNNKFIWSRIPATSLDMDDIEEALKIKSRIYSALNYVDALRMGMFVLNSEVKTKTVSDQIASCVHNAGCWTAVGSQMPQFNQNRREFAGLALGIVQRQFDSEMENIIGINLIR